MMGVKKGLSGEMAFAFTGKNFTGQEFNPEPSTGLVPAFHGEL